jgi:glycine oxidase
MALALARGAERRGAVVREHVSVNGIVLEGGRATGLRTFGGTRPVGTVVIAAGAWSRLLGDTIDLPIPTNPVRGQMLAIADPPVPLRPATFSGHGYLVPRADGTIAVGATEEHDAGFDNRVTPAGLAELAGIIAHLAPTLAQGRFVSAWAGLRPGSDDGELIVGQVPHAANIWIATGHFRSGALLAPATAELLSSSILSGTPDAGLEPFSPTRFLR